MIRRIIICVAGLFMFYGCGGVGSGSGGGSNPVEEGPYRLVKVDEYAVKSSLSKIITGYDISYNAEDYAERIEYDTGRDGVIDIVATYSYDASNNLVRVDSDDITTPSSWFMYIYLYTYTSKNILSTLERYVEEDVLDYSEEHDSNAEGLITTMRDYDEPGHTVDEIYTYTYNESNLLVLEENDMSLDGSPESTITYTYSDEGLLIREVAAGLSSVYTKEYSYDSENRIVRITEDEDSDGIINSVRTYTYDSLGRLQYGELDSDNDGNVNSRGEFFYEQGEERGTEIIWSTIYDSEMLGKLKFRTE